MRTSGWLALIGAIGISVVVGCGGNVVVDGPGDGSEGGGGTAGGTTTTTTTVFNPASYCSFVCGEGELAGCLDGGSVAECQEGCVQVFDQVGDCEEELKAYYDCVVAELPASCDGADGCLDELQELGACSGGDAG